VAAALSVLDTPPSPRTPDLWDGHAGERIAEVIVSGGGPSERLRPTELEHPLAEAQR
jgi:UDP-N-acetylglucosamine 2-epimerase (non-hydrolysing)